MTDERAEFSKRLAAAMLAQGFEPRPKVLVTQFNLRFLGTSVTFQTASRWLNGGGIPGQDKLVVLADWLKESPDFLRFGDWAAHGKRGTRQVKEEAPAYDDQKVFDIYRTLPVAQQKVVCDVILALAATPSRRSASAKPRAGAKASGHR
jgi:transcriptional regulator with XRE-family HTH domain